MSNRSDPTYGAGDPSAYAPKWVREAAEASRRGKLRKVYDRDVTHTDGAAPEQPPATAEQPFDDDERNVDEVERELGGDDLNAGRDTDPPHSDEDLYIDRFRVPPSLRSDGAAASPPKARLPGSRRGALGIIGWLILPAAIACGVAFVVF